MSFHGLQEKHQTSHIDSRLCSLGRRNTTDLQAVLHTSTSRSFFFFCNALHTLHSRPSDSSTRPVISKRDKKKRRKSIYHATKGKPHFSTGQRVEEGSSWSDHSQLVPWLPVQAGVVDGLCGGDGRVAVGRSWSLGWGPSIRWRKSSRCWRSGSGSAGSATCPCPPGSGTWPCCPSAAELGPSALRS